MKNITADYNSLSENELKSKTLESLVKFKISSFFDQQKKENVDLTGPGLHKIVIEQVEKPLIELSLDQYNGNQVKTAKMLGINRNTLKKKIDTYKIEVKKHH